MTKQHNKEDQAHSPAPPDPHSTGADSSPDGPLGAQTGRPVPLWNNLLTMGGIFLAIVGGLGLLTFGLFSSVSPTANPYVDIVGFLVLPGVLILGLVIIPFGILFKSWRLHRRNPEFKLAFRFPRIDLNDPRQRRAAKIVLGGTFILLPLVGVSSYHGYHFTDSARFCSESCHEVMEPQAVTYAQSGHARVPCAECHIGSGANWFVKAKLSGTRQVLAVLQNSYSRPIPSAIKHLRPARETCEQCHWPEKFFGAQLADLTRFASDESNTRHGIQMLLKTGGGSHSASHIAGIHKHIALAGRIEYIAADDKLQEIPWVKMTHYDGHEVVYRSDGQPHSGPKPVGQSRRMDCMDCHNRPAHNFLSPATAVDIALREGTVDVNLPFIKRESVAALVRSYPDAESAAAGIATAIASFYRANYPDVWRTRQASIRPAIEAVKRIYHTSFFSHMNVDWRTYPDNIGHKISPGCFRCHDGRHVDENGDAISHACSTCHTFLNPGGTIGESDVIHEGAFIHPFTLEGRHDELRCDRCHTGGVAPQTTCAGCHTAQAGFRAGTLVGFDSLNIPAEPMVDDVECADCHDLTQQTDHEAIDRLCLDCHEDEEERFTGMLASWKQEVEQLLSRAESTTDAEGKRVLRAVRQAGPLHNVEATRIIVRTLTEGRVEDSTETQ